ncbi:MAG: ion transporter [Clostridia bacterium]|nr:ion transporter [Clostridia bacterium]
MRKKIYTVIELADEGNKISYLYDLIMMISIVASIVPLAFKETYAVFQWIEYITLGVFVIDYLLRLWTADIKLQKGALSYIIYPFTPMAVIDLLAILPSVSFFTGGLRLLKLFRLLRTLKILRALKFLRYSSSFYVILNVFRKQKRLLSAVATMAVTYIFISALVIYNVEPESFHSFFEAVYWATISLTTVGYGDIYPVTTIGRMVTMVSSVFGVAVVALPSGVITAGYLSELSREKCDRD